MRRIGDKNLKAFFFSFFIGVLAASWSCLARAEQIKDKAEPPIRTRVEYKAEDSRDPFYHYEPKEPVPEVKPRAQAPAKLPALTVEGVVWGGNFPQAIINHRVVEVGDTLEGVQITRIDKEGIVIAYSGGVYKIPSPGAGGEKK